MSKPLSYKDIELKSILVASDFSEASSKPVRHALSIARHFHAKLYLAHVVSSVGFTIAGADALESATAAAQREVDQLESQLVESGALAGVSREFIVRQGNVWEELKAIIREKQIELIVVGTHGRQGIGKMVLGSVAEQIFREAESPVLTVGPHSLPDAPIDAAGRTRTILFPTDFGEASARALPYAISFANHFAAQLVFLHVAPVMPIPEGFNWSSSPSDITLIREDTRQAVLKRLREFVPENALSIEPEFLVDFGRHGEDTLRVAHARKADLIIMGLNHSKYAGAVSHLPQTTAYKIVCGAHCSVLTVRH